MRKPLKKNLMLLFASILAFFLLLEIVIRVSYGTYLKYDVDDELYWKLKPNQNGVPNLGLPEARINSDGFRGDELNLSLCNIMVLGDSFAFGQGVGDNETFSHILESLLGKDTEVINAGQPGWGLFQENIHFKRIYPKHNPDLAVLLLIEYDLARIPFDSEEEVQSYVSEWEFKRSVPFDSMLLRFIGLKIDGIFGTNFVMANTNYLRNQASPEILWQKQKIYVEEIADILGKDGKNLYFIAYPSLYNQSKNKQFYRLVNLSHSNIIFIDDLEKSFSGIQRDELAVSRETQHPSALAHKLIAMRIYEELRKENFTINGKKCIQ